MPVSHGNLEWLKNVTHSAWGNHRPQFLDHPKTVIIRIKRITLLKWTDDGRYPEQAIRILTQMLATNYSNGCKMLYIVFDWYEEDGTLTNPTVYDLVPPGASMLAVFKVLEAITFHFTNSTNPKIELPLGHTLFLHGCVDVNVSRNYTRNAITRNYFKNDQSLCLQSKYSTDGRLLVDITNQSVSNPFLRKLADARAAVVYFLSLHTYENVLVLDDPPVLRSRTYDSSNVWIPPGEDALDDLFLMLMAKESSYRSPEKRQRQPQHPNEHQLVNTLSLSEVVKLQNEQKRYHEYQVTVYYVNYRVEVLRNQDSLINVHEGNAVDFSHMWKCLYEKFGTPNEHCNYLYPNTDLCAEITFVLATTSLNAVITPPKGANLTPISVRTYVPALHPEVQKRAQLRSSMVIKRDVNVTNKMSATVGLKVCNKRKVCTKDRDRGLVTYLKNLKTYGGGRMLTTYTCAADTTKYDMKIPVVHGTQDVSGLFQRTKGMGVDVTFNEPLMMQFIKQAKFDGKDDNDDKIRAYCRRLQWYLYYLLNCYENPEIVPNPTSKYDKKSYFGWCVDENGHTVECKNVSPNPCESPFSLLSKRFALPTLNGGFAILM